MTHLRALALDLDGTLLRPPGPGEQFPTMSQRVARAVHRARDAGYVVIPATGRAPQGLSVPLGLLAHTGPMVVCNGAAAVAEGGQVLFEELLPAGAAAATVRALDERVPGTVVAVTRDGGHSLLVEPAYPAHVTHFQDHLCEPGDLVVEPREKLLAEPCVNLIVRHPQLGPAALAEVVAQLPDVTPMLSNEVLLEVQTAGVSKATGVARLCAGLGVSAENVIAFGDSSNDLDLMAWAGYAVAMENGTAQVRALADEIAPPVTADGVAVVLERILAEDP